MVCVLSKPQRHLYIKCRNSTLMSSITFATTTATALWWFYIRYYKKENTSCTRTAADAADAAASKNNAVAIMEYKENQKTKKRSMVAVDRIFLNRIIKLLGIMVPKVLCKETLYLILVAATMVARTYCDVWMIDYGTIIERCIISRDSTSFKKNVMLFVLAMLPVSIVNNLLKYGLSELRLLFRIRLSYYLYAEYLKGFTYYKISNLDNRISNPDQLLTQDVEKCCNSIIDLYSNVTKHFLDVIIYAKKLSGSHGLQGPSTMLAYLALSGILLTRLRRPLVKFTIGEQRLEGEYRFVNSRLISHAEEVAFFRGNKREKSFISAAFLRLIRHLRKTMQFRFSMGVVDSLIAKYCATVIGYLIVSRPFFTANHPRHMGMTHSLIMEDYYRAGRMLMNMAGGVGRLVLAGRGLTRLAGFVTRVTELSDVLSDLNKGKYKRTMIKSHLSDSTAELLVPNSGKIIEMDNIIIFDNVPLVTPDGDILVRNLSFQVKAGMNVMVAGPNGTVKSSLFRILGELWPLFGGVLVKPHPSKLFYIPQEPYLFLGTLRDQVIYPHSPEESRGAGKTDENLLQLLKLVQLDYLVDPEGGWDSLRDWQDLLSGGEKQRIAMARLFYHRPTFAILDECTSAVSVDVEHTLYTTCREWGISLFTVSHRESLWKFHEFILKFDGKRDYSFDTITSSTEQFGSS